MSRFGPRLAGAGGFINISQAAKKVVFVGTFTAGRLRLTVGNGKLRIVEEGAARKFVNEVEHRTCSGRYAVSRKQVALYVTERCVFRLAEDGLELIEIAPGVDLEKDILALMDFRPIMCEAPRLMDARIFHVGPMGLRDEMLCLPLEERFTYDQQQNLFFVNFEGYTVKSLADVERIRSLVEAKLGLLDHKVYAIVDYDNFAILPDVLDTYSVMVKGLIERFYS
ncbi:hypothetical protein [Paraburkholderia sp. MM5477-R1]|uniref:hypothetical protein n=1 Tax=Paraburkholderia sp. MM5477-R1 TaxID=2991062 RepID=UPI003D1C222B